MSKAPWVKLDLDFPTDDKMADLIVAHGAEAVGIYFLLLAHLSKATAMRLQCDRIATVAHAANVPKDRYAEVLETMVSLDLIQRSDNALSCRTLENRLDRYQKKVEQNRQNALKRWDSDATAMRPHSNGNATAEQSQSVRNAEEKRVEQNRTEQKRERRPPNTGVLKAFFEEKGLPAAAAAREAEKFIDYYTAIGWVIGKARTPMKDWRAAARGWYARMDNKPAVVNHNNWQ